MVRTDNAINQYGPAAVIGMTDFAAWMNIDATVRMSGLVNKVWNPGLAGGKPGDS
jgi:hypothetical protein